LSEKEHGCETSGGVFRLCLVAVAALLSVLLPRIVPASPTQLAEPDADSLKVITVTFKLDPRLSGGTYGGERWVSPPTYTGATAQDTIEARVGGMNAKGRPVRISATWTASDPEMVTVTPGQKNEFRITVKRTGESKLTVASQGVSKELLVRAKKLGNAIQVEIIQESAEKPRPGGPAADPGATAAAPSAPVLPDEKTKSSYALGMEMGKRLKGQFPELDAELVSRGLKDALAGDKALFTEGELKAALAAVQYEVQTRRVQAQKELAEKNKKDGETFLASNKAKEGVVTLESGLQYKVLKAGEGQKPTIDDTVVSHYRGTLVDGTEFDSSYKRQRPGTFALKRVIRGWREALQLMPVGSEWQIFVPPDLAYGAKGAGGTIGPNATLLFDVELLAIKRRPTAATQRQTPQPSVASDKSPKS
jgi:FKBP-type peptidyl-prolyl cis-trans isomerase FklB